MLTDAAGEAQNSFTPGVDTKIVVRAVAAGLKSQVFWVNNHVPGLNWTGETNYIGDGLDPETGYSNTDFVFRIKYTDSDNDAPAVHRVWIDVDGNDVFEPSEGFDMNRVSSPIYVAGVFYEYTTTLPFSAGSSNIKYYFEFRDRVDLPSAGGITAVNQAGAISAPDVLRRMPNVGIFLLLL